MGFSTGLVHWPIVSEDDSWLVSQTHNLLLFFDCLEFTQQPFPRPYYPSLSLDKADFLGLKRQQEMKTSESIQGPGIMRSWASKIMPNFASLNSLSDESIKLRWRKCSGHLGK